MSNLITTVQRLSDQDPAPKDLMILGNMYIQLKTPPPAPGQCKSECFKPHLTGLDCVPN